MEKRKGGEKMERPEIPLTLTNYFSRKIFPRGVLFLWLILVPQKNAFAWELAKEGKGITVHTREVDGSNFKEYRAVMNIKTSLSSLIALVADISAYPSWIHTCQEGKLLKRISLKEIYAYTINNAPWPVNDRDAIVHNTIIQDNEDQSVTIKIVGVPDYIPPQKGLVRVKMIDGYWRFTPVENSMVQVIYQVHNDPGGDLPSWLVNSVVVSQPYNTLVNMQKRVLLPKYRDAEYEFIKE